jgi:hypothetical protein
MRALREAGETRQMIHVPVERIVAVLDGMRFGRQHGYRPTAKRYSAKVLKFVGAGQSYRELSHRLGISARHRQARSGSVACLLLRLRTILWNHAHRSRAAVFSQQ